MKLAITSALAVGLLAACGGGGTTSSPAAGGGSGTNLSTGSATLNGSSTTVITESTGLTLYYFLPEKGGTLGQCDAACLGIWPPITVTGTPTVASGLNGSVATVALSDGRMEVTYNGWPLHRYAGGAGPPADSGPGQTNGNGIDMKWYAATPGLTAAGGAGSGSSTSATPSGSGYGY